MCIPREYGAESIFAKGGQHLSFDDSLFQARCFDNEPCFRLFHLPEAYIVVQDTDVILH